MREVIGEQGGVRLVLHILVWDRGQAKFLVYTNLKLGRTRERESPALTKATFTMWRSLCRSLLKKQAAVLPNPLIPYLLVYTLAMQCIVVCDLEQADSQFILGNGGSEREPCIALYWQKIHLQWVWGSLRRSLLKTRPSATKVSHWGNLSVYTFGQHTCLLTHLGETERIREERLCIDENCICSEYEVVWEGRYLKNDPVLPQAPVVYLLV